MSLATDNFDKPVILIVDDDEEIRLLLAHTMEQEGYQVVGVKDGEEGLVAFSELNPDVVLLDALMPVMDGFTTCARLRELPGGDVVPILLITGLRDEKSVDRAFEAGATDYITKPLNRAVLRQRVRRMYRARQAEEALLRTNHQLIDRISELERRNQQISLLSQLGELLQLAENAAEIYSVVAQLIPQIFENESGILGIINHSLKVVEVVAEWGMVGKASDFDTNDCQALLRGHLYSVENTRTGLICRHWQGQPLPLSYLCVPLETQDELLGVLQLSQINPEAEMEGLTQARQRLAATVAERIALALANLKLQETLRIQSVRDPLTALFNRRYMEESLEREMHRVKRNKRSLGIIMLDLDHFKQFNDTYGHDAGDLILRVVGDFLQTRVREEDVACRYGGEEFLLILPEISLSDAQQRAENLREQLSSIKLQYNNRPVGPVTASFGIALYPDHGNSAEAVIRAADEALYLAKQKGRDQVVVAPNIKHF